MGLRCYAVGIMSSTLDLMIKKYKEIRTFPLLSSNTYVNGARLFEAATIDKNKGVEGDRNLSSSVLQHLKQLPRPTLKNVTV